MKEIFNILKKYSFYIILVLVLLVIQAACDLSLPEYTSKIVNIGIQQSGIEKVVPKALTVDSYNKIIEIVSNKELLINNYELVKKDTLPKEKYETYLKEYPILNTNDIYILKPVDVNTKNKINDQLLLPMIMTLDLEKYKDQTNLFSNSSINFDDLEPMMLQQISISALKLEYQKIGIDLSKLQMDYIISAGIKMLLLSFLAMLVTIITTYISSRISAFFSRDLRKKVVNKVMTYSNKEFEEISTSSLITRSTNDIQQIQIFIVMLLRTIIYAPIMGIGAFTKVSNSSMSWVIGVAVLSIMSLVLILLVVALPKFQKVQQKIDKLNLVVRETLSGISVIRAFSNEKYELKKFDNANKDLMKINLFVNRIMVLMMPTMMLIMNCVCVLIVWVGAEKIDAGIIQIGTLIAFITYTMQIIMSFLMFSMVSIMMPRALVSFKRVGEVFNKNTSIQDKEKTQKFKKELRGVVEFKDVYFRYPDAEEDVLKNISFKSLPGTTTAFIGSTGSGKSTLINLIPRFFDVTGGKILVDGVNIKDVKIKDLRSKIGYVPQKGLLFSGTIKSNIEFGTKRLSDITLEKIAKISQASEFINKKEKKFDSEISQGGTNVSGGQRQRIAIARALAMNPDIYIFDDSFSALDYKTDTKLRKELSKETKNSTIFIVASRISTIMNADQIIVLEKGEIVGIGTHKELLKKCNVYKEIALSQLSKEELNNE